MKIEWEILDDWVDPGPAMLVNSPFALPPERRSHVVVVGHHWEDVEVEHTGCPLLEYPGSERWVSHRGYDCVVEWMLHEMQARRVMPAALVLNTVNPIMVQGAALADFTMMSGFATDITQAVPDGAWVEVDTEASPPCLRIVAPPEGSVTDIAGTDIAGTGIAGNGIAGTGIAGTDTAGAPHSPAGT